MYAPSPMITRPATTPSRPASTWTGWGQWLALTTMTLDHLTRYVLPSDWQLDWMGSSLGRIAFPLFAAMVAWHGLFNTRNPLRYARRILVIGLIAQLPYMMMPRASDVFILNVCFTLSLGLSWAAMQQILLDRHRRGDAGTLKVILATLASLAAWHGLGNWVEYGHEGLLLIPLLMLAMHRLHHTGPAMPQRLAAVACAIPALVATGLLNSRPLAKSFAIATSLAVLGLAAGAHRLTPAVPFTMPRWLWLAWYPGHFALMALWVGGVALWP